MPEQTFTPRTFARILSRAFSLYLLVWALSNLLYLPEFLFSFFHYLHLPAETNQRHYWLIYYLTRAVAESLRSLALLIFSGYLWKNGTFLLYFFEEKEKDAGTIDLPKTSNSQD